MSSGGNGQGGLPPHYDPASIERQLYQAWERDGLFSPKGDGDGYCIMLPPPNVTGRLHMGHAFQHSLMDILIRCNIMRGRRTLWQCGTDHAGIATQIVVENQLRQRGIERADLSREEFVQAVWQWKQKSGSAIGQQMRRLGTAMDWTRERFTLDEGPSQAVREVFIQLFAEGLIYRGTRLVNWDPVLCTAVSDLEVNAEQEQGHMWHIRYAIENQPGSYITIATTRPETMFGDTAVAVHPEDKRYLELVGSKVVLPISGRSVEIIADRHVDPGFGSGCVKITPAHDFNDYQVGLRHKLPMLDIFTDQACLNENVPESFRGLGREQARTKLVAELDAIGALQMVEDREMMVPRGERTGAILEPRLTRQWFVRVAPLAEPAIEAVRSGQIRFIPDNWSKTYFAWMENIQDWCISRQLWWGHRIPVWYGAGDDEIYAGHDEQDVRRRHNLPGDKPLRQDPDVLDTWFSSALWPFSSLGWPQQGQDMKSFYPTNVLVTGFDIIFFWVARMIMMGLKFTKEVPFREVYIHGLVRDATGRKMSKSYGNILDPIDLIDGIDIESLVANRTSALLRPGDAPAIEKETRKQFPKGIAPYGADALRFTFAALATGGRDIRFDTGRIQGYRNFCNKLWNATRFVLAQLADGERHDVSASAGAGADAGAMVQSRWIESTLHRTVAEVNRQLDGYRFDLVAQALHSFVWDQYCDWYLEMAKQMLRGEPEQAAEARRMLLRVLACVLRLAHPLLPFISEELWQKVAPHCGLQGGPLLQQDYPKAEDFQLDLQAEQEMLWVQSVVTGVRRIRSMHDLDAGRRLQLRAEGGDDNERQWLGRHSQVISSLGRIDFIADGPPTSDCATERAGGMTLCVPLGQAIDHAAELQRLNGELARQSSARVRVQGKLDNEQFMQRAPAEVVAKERQRLVDIDQSVGKLRQQIEMLEKAVN